MVEPSDTPAPSAEAGRQIHRRLLESDPTASSDLAAVFLEPLIGWLDANNPSLHPHWVVEAAEDAILSLIRDPNSYHPQESDLESYLRMSAQGDLRNLLHRESRHHAGRKS